MSGINAFLKKIWGSDLSVGSRIGAWATAIIVWQLVDKDHSVVWARYNEYKYEQKNREAQEALHLLRKNEKKPSP